MTPALPDPTIFPRPGCTGRAMRAINAANALVVDATSANTGWRAAPRGDA